MYEIDTNAYSTINIEKIPSMTKDELIENSNHLKDGSEEQIKAGLNLWMMALDKDPTDATLISKIATYQNNINDSAGALETYSTRIETIKQAGNNPTGLSNLYLGRAQMEIYDRTTRNYEQAKTDLKTASKLSEKSIDQSLMYEIEDGIAREQRNKNQ